MSDSVKTRGYVARRKQDVEPTACPCGEAYRIITRRDSLTAGFHITHIQDSKRHFHKKTTEIYHILEGSGVLEIGDDRLELEPGLTILIEPGTPHRGYGDFKTIVVPVPAFDPEDEYLCEDDGAIDS
ncbi:MAG: cupin domain-containing protein [bacterium]|nr:cupin domain-containing protein [bacterium]